MQKLLTKGRLLYASSLATPIRSYLWLSMEIEAEPQQRKGKSSAATLGAVS